MGGDIHGNRKVNAVIETSLAVGKKKAGFHHKFWYRWFFKRKHKRFHEVTLFKQRDIDLSPLGFDKGITPFDEISDISLGRDGLVAARVIIF
ncbi:MAG: hypothetical protein CM1200mP3_16480 [Chloroflexota bacterium]|nr:MAG: hypothetical protein CM1200mP3_16480 [Chloroflexota bacterium]